MKPRMIADLMALTVHPLHYSYVVLRLRADHEEGARHVVLLQNVENLGRPGRVGTVVKTKGHFVRVVAGLLHSVGERKRAHRLLGSISCWICSLSSFAGL